MKKYSLLLFVVLLLMGCQKDSPNSPSTVESGEWQFDQFREYTVAGSQSLDIDDPISGCTFHFPQGGSGKFRVFSIADGPELGIDTSQPFYVDYLGTGEVEIRIPVDPEERTTLLYYGEIDNAAIHKSDGNIGWWTMLESAVEDSEAVYPLAAFSTKLQKAAAGGYQPPNSKVFAINQIKAGSSDWIKQTNQFNTVQQVIDVWLNQLPASISTEARQQIRGDLSYDVRPSDKNYYQAFDNWVVGKNAVFFFQSDAGLVTIAHEVGHYMNHVMCGYNRYIEIYKLMPAKLWGLGGSITHDLGYYHEGRVYLLEEYAYVSQYLITGEVDRYDLFNVANTNYFSQMFGTKPDRIDYPSQEGFGAGCLISLTRDASKQIIKTFDTTNYPTSKVPVLNFSLSDALAVLAQGPRNIDELRQTISTALAGKGPDETKKMSAALEPLGWSYHGKVTIVDQDNKPVKGAAAQSIIKIGNETYSTRRTLNASDDGICHLYRLYPGTSELRVFYNYSEQEFAHLDSADFAINIDWSKPTNQSIELPQIQINIDAKPKITAVSPDGGYPKTYVRINGEHFGQTRGTSRVFFGGVAATDYNWWSDTEITLYSPEGATGTVLWVEVDKKKSNEWPFKSELRVPRITEVRMEDGVDVSNFLPIYGDTLRIRGEFFGVFESGKSRVTIGETDLIIVSWSDGDILAKVPQDCPPGDLVVRLGTLISNAVNVPVFDVLEYAQSLQSIKFNIQTFTMQVNYDDGSRGTELAFFLPLGDDLPKPTFAGRAFVSEKNQVNEVGWRYYYKISGTLAPDYRSIASLRVDGVEDYSTKCTNYSVEIKNIPLQYYDPDFKQVRYSTGARGDMSASQLVRCSYVFTSKSIGVKSFTATAFDISSVIANITFFTK